MSDTILPIKLVAPVIEEGLTVKEAIMKRHTSREFSSQPLSLKLLSELMWAAYGVNRKATHGRTTPAAWGIYPLEIYAMTADGVYLYDPEEHKLNPIAKGDLRGLSGEQDFVGGAALDIVIFADRDKMKTGDAASQALMDRNIVRLASLDAGAATENVYLYATSAGLNVVERVYVDDEKLRKGLGLADSRMFVVALTVGYPA
ncbi:MAG: SagB/ThcOx family dehydrogenase [Paramuribaculum sp.]